jgi:hypothetical protein
MKIKSNDPVGGASSVKKASRTKSAGGTFASHLSEPEETQGVTGTSAVGSLDSILSLQGVGDATEGNRKAKQYGEDVLKSLELLLHDLLDGSIPRSHLQQLADLMQEQREFGQMSPKMQEIVEEIETRALIELAKYEMRS